MLDSNGKIIFCNLCDISNNRNNILNGQGNKNNKIMFIGESPGYYEDKLNKVMVGTSGEFFTKCLNLIGLMKDDVYITNVIKCKPPNNRAPLAKEIKNCNPYLLYELYTIQPKIVILLGSVALNTYFNTSGIKVRQVIGNIIIKNKIAIIPTYHPSYIVRNIDNYKLINMYINDFKHIGQLYRLLINPFLTFNFKF